MPPQLIVMIGLGITYSVTGGSSLHNFYTIVCHKNGMGECHSAGLSVWIIVFSAIHLVIIQVIPSASLSVHPFICLSVCAMQHWHTAQSYDWQILWCCLAKALQALTCSTCTQLHIALHVILMTFAFCNDGRD